MGRQKKKAQERVQINVGDVMEDIDRYAEILEIPENVWQQLSATQKVKAIIQHNLSTIEAELEEEE